MDVSPSPVSPFRRLAASSDRTITRFVLPFALLCAGLPVPAQVVYGPSQTLTQPSSEVRVTLSRPVYRITIDPKTGAPQMPHDVIATAEVGSPTSSAGPPRLFRWHVTLHWNYKPYPTAHRIETQEFVQASPFRLPLDGQVRGGTLVVTATTTDAVPLKGTARAEVLAENPTRAMVLKAFPPNRIGLLASKICMAESGMQQFTVAKGLDTGGRPYVSPSNDIGMMQLNAPSGGVTSAEEVWDWRANLRRGLAMLGEKRQTILASRGRESGRSLLVPYTFEGRAQFAAANMNRLLLGLDWLSLPPAPPISDAPGSGLLPGEPDPDHLLLTQREREAIRRYNGGSEYACHLCLDDTALNVRVLGWQPDPERGGISLRRGDPLYVNHVLLARSGFTLPKPPKTPVRSPRRTHRRRA